MAEDKKCRRCCFHKPISSFAKNNRSADGYTIRCKACIQEVNYVYIEKNKSTEEINKYIMTLLKGFSECAKPLRIQDYVNLTVNKFKDWQ